MYFIRLTNFAISYYSRPLEEFMDRSKNRDIALIKHEHYEKRRREKLSAVREERQMIMRYLHEFDSGEGRGIGKLFSTFWLQYFMYF